MVGAPIFSSKNPTVARVDAVVIVVVPVVVNASGVALLSVIVPVRLKGSVKRLHGPPLPQLLSVTHGIMSLGLRQWSKLAKRLKNMSSTFRVNSKNR